VVSTISLLVMVISVYPEDKNGGFDLSTADLIWAAADSQFLISGVGESEY
jgi:hypothetical protein